MAEGWKRYIGPVLLVVVGCVQMAGDLLGLPVVKAIGAASSASPAPKVFTAQRGFETYSARFFVMWRDKQGAARELHLTPEVYAGVQGPYNRRNAYGAALSYAPVLFDTEITRPMLNSATKHTFCGNSTILEEIGIDRSNVDGAFQFELRPRQQMKAGHTWKLKYEVSCND
ncbi:hypothetical protein [Altererythrobacter sp. ZODW24]|uniref:hypothetical protein n=1 Tax=Altererythrobacter sp. ZODW24 TaxID=2185142 RepID=UPI000DF75AD7|nr:hypothetical protein [Altererythrobacter sp. ZODW24]